MFQLLVRVPVLHCIRCILPAKCYKLYVSSMNMKYMCYMRATCGSISIAAYHSYSSSATRLNSFLQ